MTITFIANYDNKFYSSSDVFCWKSLECVHILLSQYQWCLATQEQWKYGFFLPLSKTFLGFQNKRYTLSQNTSVSKSQNTENPLECSFECVNSDIMLNNHARVSIDVYITALDCNSLSRVLTTFMPTAILLRLCSEYFYGTIQLQTYKNSPSEQYSKASECIKQVFSYLLGLLQAPYVCELWTGQPKC